MPRNNNRKSSGRQLSKTELLIQEEQQQKRNAMRQQRHREYLGRQQRRDNKARNTALKTSGYKPSWMIERERQLANSKQQVKQTPSFAVLNVHDDDEKSLRRQERDHAKAPKPVKASACSGVWARGLAPKSVAPKSLDKSLDKSVAPKSLDKPVVKRTGWDSDDDDDDDDDDAWPKLTTSNWADDE